MKGQLLSEFTEHRVHRKPRASEIWQYCQWNSAANLARIEAEVKYGRAISHSRLLILFAVSFQRGAQVPVFEINQTDSSIKFNVKASIAIAGTFDKWDAAEYPYVLLS